MRAKLPAEPAPFRALLRSMASRTAALHSTGAAADHRGQTTTSTHVSSGAQVQVPALKPNPC